MKILRPLIALAVLICLAFWLSSIKQPIENVDQALKISKVKKTEKIKDIVIPIKMVAINKSIPQPRKKTIPTKSASNPPKKNSLSKEAHKKDARPSSGKDSTAKGHNDPTVIASFNNLRVQNYLACMESMGARVALYDRRARDFACRLRPDGRFAGPVNTAGMSARARTLTNDFPGSDEILEQAALRYGRSLYEIVLLLPHNLDDRFRQGIKTIIQAHGQRYSDVLSVRINYKLLNNRIQVVVRSLETIGGSVAVNDSFAL